MDSSKAKIESLQQLSPQAKSELLRWLETYFGMSKGKGSKGSGSGGGTAVVSLGSQFDIKVIDDNSALITGDGQFQFMIPSDMNGWELTAVAANVFHVSSSGKPTFQVRNTTTGFDMLLTPITIDVSELNSYTAATPSVIDGSHSTVSTGDVIAVDVDVAGTGTLGLGVALNFGAVVTYPVSIALAATQTFKVTNTSGNVLFEVDQNGDLHGKTGKALTFDR